jgi:hypothetical protein
MLAVGYVQQQLLLLAQQHQPGTVLLAGPLWHTLLHVRTSQLQSNLSETYVDAFCQRMSLTFIGTVASDRQLALPLPLEWRLEDPGNGLCTGNRIEAEQYLDAAILVHSCFVGDGFAVQMLATPMAVAVGDTSDGAPSDSTRSWRLLFARVPTSLN